MLKFFSFFYKKNYSKQTKVKNLVIKALCSKTDFQKVCHFFFQKSNGFSENGHL